MALKTVVMTFGRFIEFVKPLPANAERMAASHGLGIGGMVTVKTWPSRAAMARTVRMQQRREPRNDDWKPLVRLTDGEGY